MLIEVRNLHKRYGTLDVLRDISFSVCKPSIIGLLGNNGAGKSTLMKVLTGMSKKESGKVSVLGSDPWREWRNLYSEIAVLFEPKIPKYLTNYEYLKEICILRNLDQGKIPEILELVGLESSKKRVKDYSFGMTQRLGLAGALITESKLLILDEPFVGLDPSGIKDLQKTIKKLSDKGILVLVSSHQLSELEDLVDRILLIEKGSLKLDCNIKDLSKNKKLKIKTTDNKMVSSVLSKRGFHISSEDNYLIIDIGSRSIEEITTIISKLNIVIQHVEVIKNKLETLFV